MKHILLLFVGLLCINGITKAQDPVISMTTAIAVGQNISFKLTAQNDNTPIQVDFGNGTKVDFTIGTVVSSIPGTLGGAQSVKIYGSGITKIDCSNIQLTALDVTKCTALKILWCLDNQLTALDITQCTALTEIACQNNQLSALDVTKCTVLTNLYCYNNQLKVLDVTKCTALIDLYSNGNQLTGIDVTQCTALEDFWCQQNQLTALDVTKCTILKTLYCYFNQLTALDVTKCTNLTKLSCSNNKFSLATLPFKQATWTFYSYSPLIEMAIPATINSVDLSAQASINGNLTTFIWKTAGGTTLTEGIDYTINNGVTTFLKTQSEKVYCQMTNATFPDFAGTSILKTTQATIGTSTAIDSPSAPSVEVYAVDATLYLNLPTAAQVSVTDLQGRIIASTLAENGQSTLALPGSGLYVVRVMAPNGVTTHKVMVK